MVEAPDHPVIRLSAAGLRHAVRMRHLPVSVLARRVYTYHALPFARAPYTTLRGWSDVARWLGLAAGDDVPGFVAAADPDGHWMHWRRPATGGVLCHKLYISPRPEAIPGLFRALTAALDTLAVPAFKCGASARGLLRPDKLVAYFASRDHLLAVAEELAASFLHVPVHGVPFTAPLDATGLLSWGFDPGASAGSWRLYVAGTIAQAVARASAGPLEHTMSHVRESLRLAGVDPDRWEPNGAATT